MLAERVYRWLLFVYPREHRREYGDLMVQLFRDRMRCDGSGFRGLFVWSHMIFDLAGAAFKEHKEGSDMRKLSIVGIALAVVLVAGVIGVGTLLAQSKGEEALTVLKEVRIWESDLTGSCGVAEAMRQAVEEGAIDEEAAARIVEAAEGDGSDGVWRYDVENGVVADALRQAVEEGVISQSSADTIARLAAERRDGVSASSIFVMKGAPTISATASGGIAEAVRQALEEGSIDLEEVDGIVSIAVDGDANAKVGHYNGGADGVAGAIRQAVEEGVISQSLADVILRSFDDGNTGS